MLDGIDYELYSFVDSLRESVIRWEDLARFETVLIEDGAGGQILLNAGSHSRLLSFLVDAGRHVIYFSFPPGAEHIDFTRDVSTIEYTAMSPEHRYLGLDSSICRGLRSWYSGDHVKDTLAGFVRAEPADGWPLVEYAGARGRVSDIFAHFFDPDSCLPCTPAFFPDERARAIYTYGSAWPECSHLHGLTCGVEMIHLQGRAHAFSFHLRGIRERQARRLVEKLLDQPSSHPSATPMPKDFDVQ